MIYGVWLFWLFADIDWKYEPKVPFAPGNRTLAFSIYFPGKITEGLADGSDYELALSLQNDAFC